MRCRGPISSSWASGASSIAGRARLRNSSSARRRFRSAILCSALREHGQDPLNILADSHRRAQDAWLSAWPGAHAQTRFDALPERAFAENRLAHWNGPIAQATLGRIQICPLLSPKAARLYLALSAKARARELLHYEVMRRTRADFARLPFLADAWDESLAARDASLARGPYPSEGPQPRTWQWAFAAGEADAITALLSRALRDPRLHEIVDGEKLLTAARGDRELKKNIEVKALFSAIALAHGMLGEVEAARDGFAPGIESEVA